jgi:VIT1/CCC1 family predicted Fe2+/Mn2+ transporter
MADERSTGDRLLRIGAVVTVIGLVCTVIAMLPLVVPDLELPSVWWFLSMITGVGLALVILGLAISARSRHRR